MNFIIKEATITDAERIIDYINQVSGETDNLTFGYDEFKMSVEEEIEYLKNIQQTPTSLYLIALVSNQIVGSLNFTAGTRPRISHSGEFGVTVLKDYWNNGIGKALIKQLIYQSKQNGIIKKINLIVRSDNKRAIFLYKKLGFKTEGLITREFQIDGKFYDSYHMGLGL